MKYYAAIKNNEFVSFVQTWMNLETIILSKLAEEQKTKHHVFIHSRVMNNENTWAQGREQHSQSQVWGRGDGGGEDGEG